MNENRQQLWDEYTGRKEPYIAHPWLHYDRYHEANNIIKTLEKNNVDITQLKVFDYGSGIGDYGMSFLRKFAKEVVFYDYTYYLDFITFRLASEKEHTIEQSLVRVIPALEAPEEVLKFSTYDVVIFGEVLEHLENPLKVLQTAIGNNTKYIYTSSYPFRSDDPNDSYWNHRGHQNNGLCEMQKPCRELLQQKYTSIKFDGESRLWKKNG